MTDKHMSTQFDAELSGVSTRVLEMGGVVESQVAQRGLRADPVQQRGRLARCWRPRSASTRTEVEIDRDLSTDHRAAPADRARPAPADRDLQDHRQPRARRRRGGAHRAHRAAPREHAASRAAAPAGERPAPTRPSSPSRSCARRSMPSPGSTSSRAVEVLKQDDLIDQEFDGLMRKLITFMMEDPRTISASIDLRVRRQGDRARRRPREEPGRADHLHRQGHRRAPQQRSATSRRWCADAHCRKRHEPRSWSSRTSRRSPS